MILRVKTIPEKYIALDLIQQMLVEKQCKVPQRSGLGNSHLRARDFSCNLSALAHQPHQPNTPCHFFLSPPPL